MLNPVLFTLLVTNPSGEPIPDASVRLRTRDARLLFENGLLSRASDLRTDENGTAVVPKRTLPGRAGRRRARQARRFYGHPDPTVFGVFVWKPGYLPATTRTGEVTLQPSNPPHLSSSRFREQRHADSWFRRNCRTTASST